MTATAVQRPFRGSRISSFWPIKSLPTLSSLDSAFQLQEYISLLVRHHVHDVEAIVSLPGSKGNSEKDSEASKANDSSENDDIQEHRSEVVVDEACWIYEQLRRLALDLSFPLISKLQEECTRTSCPEMKAGEWLYLCVAHGNDGAMEQCCAIDYILHTLDSATALLNSPKAFPSRLSIPAGSHRHFSSLARRLGRIFAHAYFHHREAFEQAEAESSLYERFRVLSSKFELVPDEFLVIPPVRDGGEDAPRSLGTNFHEHDLEEEHDEDRLQQGSSTFDEGVEEQSREGDSEYLDHSSWSLKPNQTNLEAGLEASPRKNGRSRTDTMIFSEGPNIMDEIAKNETGILATDSEVGVTEVAAAEDPATATEGSATTTEGPATAAEGFDTATDGPATATEAEVVEELGTLVTAVEVVGQAPEDLMPGQSDQQISADITDEIIPPVIEDKPQSDIEHSKEAFPSPSHDEAALENTEPTEVAGTNTTLGKEVPAEITPAVPEEPLLPTFVPNTLDSDAHETISDGPDYPAPEIKIDNLELLERGAEAESHEDEAGV